MKLKPLTVIGFLGSTLDAGQKAVRWARWRPSVALCQHADLPIARFDLLFQPRFDAIRNQVCEDLKQVSPHTDVRCHELKMPDPWEFESVYSELHDFARNYPFNVDTEDYLVHITTGSHVAQICLFLLTESRHFPARLLQTSPPPKVGTSARYSIIDLDLSKYDKLASRFTVEARESASVLKGGIETRNKKFNRLIDEIEHVAIGSRAPILLMGPTGAGKSQLAKRIFELKKHRRQVEGKFIEVNCATIRGDGAMSALFGHKKGAFTGAATDRAGLLRAADGGVLFLDEVGELGADEQAMLLRAIEDKRFSPLGSDSEITSDFQLIAGTNADLHQSVRIGRFREDLLARINLWTFKLPPLKDRTEDIEPNIQYELDQFARAQGNKITFNKEAHNAFVRFATSSEAVWAGNFRDLNAAITRMGTLARGGRIGVDLVEAEIVRLRSAWKSESIDEYQSILKSLFDEKSLNEIDLFDCAQLAEVIRICRLSRSLSDAGRKLFSASRTKKESTNDADRLRKYLARFKLDWASVSG